MLKLKLSLPLLLVSILGPLACGEKAGKVGETSDLMYGFLNNKTASLLTLKPGDKVLVCGTQQENLRELAFVSVKKWSEASGRANLVVEQNESCTNRKQYAASIAVAYNGSNCQGNILGYHSQSGQHHDIVSCPLAKSSQGPATMLHEVGHAWGLCDQYDENNAARITFHDNCQSQYKSAAAARSIMGGGYQNSPNGLTEDDFLGIRIGACRPDIAANTAWLRANAEIVAEWKTPAFKAEVERIQKLGAGLLAECTSAVTTPVTPAPVTPTPETPPPVTTPVTPAPVTPAPVADLTVCDRLTQSVVVNFKFFFWTGIQFSLAGSAADLDQIASVRWSIHESFPNTLLSSNRASNFATPSVYTGMDGWESKPAQVKLKSGGSCPVKGTVVRL